MVTIVLLQTSHLRPLTLSLLGAGLRGGRFSVWAPMQTKHGMCSVSHNTLKAMPLSKVLKPHRALWWTGNLMKTRRDSNKSNMYINSNNNSTETQPHPFKCAMMWCYWNRYIVILILLYKVIMLALATEQKLKSGVWTYKSWLSVTALQDSMSSTCWEGWGPGPSETPFRGAWNSLGGRPSSRCSNPSTKLQELRSLLLSDLSVFKSKLTRSHFFWNSESCYIHCIHF